jgi:hypothetical protein
MDIGLLKCYSNICKKFPEIENYLFDDNIPIFKLSALYYYNRTELLHQDNFTFFGGDSPSILERIDPALLTNDDPGDLSDDLNSISTDKLHFNPKNPSSPHSSEFERESLRHFLIPFKRASIATIAWLSLTFFLSSFLLLVVFFESCLVSFALLSNNLKNILLLVITFSMFVALLFYLSLSYSCLHNGSYVDGVWIVAYTTVMGLLACLLLNILDNHYEIERLQESVEIYIHSHHTTPVRDDDRNGERTTRTTIITPRSGAGSGLGGRRSLTPTRLEIGNGTGRGNGVELGIGSTSSHSRDGSRRFELVPLLEQVDKQHNRQQQLLQTGGGTGREQEEQQEGFLDENGGRIISYQHSSSVFPPHTRPNFEP